MPTQIIPKHTALELLQRDYQAWERFIARREVLIDGIDWQMMLPAERRAVEEAEENIMEEGAWLWCEMEHLERSASIDPWWYG